MRRLFALALATAILAPAAASAQDKPMQDKPAAAGEHGKHGKKEHKHDGKKGHDKHGDKAMEKPAEKK